MTYYEELIKNKGIKIPFWIAYVRDAEKVAVRQRKKLLKEARK